MIFTKKTLSTCSPKFRLLCRLEGNLKIMSEVRDRKLRAERKHNFFGLIFMDSRYGLRQ